MKKPQIKVYLQFLNIFLEQIMLLTIEFQAKSSKIRNIIITERKILWGWNCL